jgi:threonine dehydratase
MDIAGEVISAEKVIRSYIRETYLEYSPFYSRMTGANVYFKLENLQYTGSFKLRGAMNKLLSLTDEEKGRGVVTASTGNHGAAFAYGLSKVEGTGVVFVPENASASKVEAIERLGAEVRHIGSDCVETEAQARHYAEINRMTYMPPYNDVKVIGGQGTIAVELAKQLDQIDAVFVALGGGGMISGIGGFLKPQIPGVEGLCPVQMIAQQTMMAHHTFGKSGGAGSIHYEQWVRGTNRGCPLFQCMWRNFCGLVSNILPTMNPAGNRMAPL